MATLRIESIAIDKLIPDPDNARQHDDKNLSAIKGSLKNFGQVKPIVVFGDNIVIAGNGTLQGAKELGWTEINIVRIPKDWEWDKARAYALADNRTSELAEWDAEILKDTLIELDAVGWAVEEFGFEALQPPTNPEPRNLDWLNNLRSTPETEIPKVYDPNFTGGEAYGLPWAFTSEQRQTIVSAVNQYKAKNPDTDAPTALYEICKDYQ